MNEVHHELDSTLLGYYSDFDNFLFSSHLPFGYQDDIFNFKHDNIYAIIDDLLRIDNIHSRIRFFIERTTVFHELKHFHDSITSCMGLERKLIFEQLLLDIIMTLSKMEDVEAFRIPFRTWVTRRDCPSSVKKAYSFYSEYISWMQKWFLSTSYQKKYIVMTKKTFTDGSPFPNIIFHVLEDTFLLPCVEISENGKDYLFPISTSAILEGSALSYEVWLYSVFFNENDPNIFTEFIKDSGSPLKYGITINYMIMELGYINMELLFAISYLSLMGCVKDEGLMNRHPGIRFIKAIKFLKDEKIVPSKDTDISDIYRIIDSIIESNGWTKLGIIYDFYLNYFMERKSSLDKISHSKESRTAKIIYSATINKVIQALEYCLSISPKAIYDIGIYFHSMDFLPHPNIYGFKNKSLIITEPDMTPIVKYFVSNMILNIMLNNKIVCPFKRNGLLCDLQKEHCEMEHLESMKKNRPTEPTDTQCYIEFAYLYLGLDKKQIISLA